VLGCFDSLDVRRVSPGNGKSDFSGNPGKTGTGNPGKETLDVRDRRRQGWEIKDIGENPDREFFFNVFLERRWAAEWSNKVKKIL
jgi:hypothetical protein